MERCPPGDGGRGVVSPYRQSPIMGGVPLREVCPCKGCLLVCGASEWDVKDVPFWEESIISCPLIASDLFQNASLIFREVLLRDVRFNINGVSF